MALDNLAKLGIMRIIKPIVVADNVSQQRRVIKDRVVSAFQLLNKFFGENGDVSFGAPKKERLMPKLEKGKCQLRHILSG